MCHLSGKVSPLAIALLGAASGLPWTSHTLADDKTPQETVPLREYIALMGRKLDCYFTVEEKRRGEWVRWTLSSRISSDPKVSSVDALIKHLNSKLRDVEVFQSQGNPAIIHLVDKRLLRIKGYVLERRLDLKYSGELGDLADALNRRVKDIRRTYFYTTGDGLRYVDPTPVRVSAQNRAVRRLLSDYIPLSEYKRLLWFVEADPDGVESHMTVAYLGREHRPLSTGETFGDRLMDFALGEVAFANNPATCGPSSSDDSASRAIEFIERRMKQKQPLQVRWAMLYLGKWQFDEGIPVLLKYIDYQYTTCGILEESYPALKALRQIGKPAAEAALKAIAAETKDLRIELLCNAVVSVDGLDKTKKILDQRVADAKNPDEKKRYQQALKHFETIKAKQLELDSIKETPVDQPANKKGK